MKLFFAGHREALVPFNNYQLVAMRPAIRMLVLVASVFNALLLIPDLMHVTGAAVIAVIVLRVVFSAATAFLFAWFAWTKSYRVYSKVATVTEAAALLVFLVVFCLYPTPDFTIQMLGMIVITMFIYLVPNRWANMNMVSGLGIIGFLICSLFIAKGLDSGQIAAGAIYLAVVSVLFAMFSLYIRSYQYREYVSRSDLLRDYTTDPLTRLGNRVKLEEEAAKWLDRVIKFEVPLSLAVVDVDNMKQINDTYGHIVGDAVLCQLAEVMARELRKDDVCVRWGGDEFVLLLPYTNAQEAKKMAERMERAIRGHKYDPPVLLTCSFGVAQTQPGLSLNALIAQADKVMYAAKQRAKSASKVQMDGGGTDITA